MPNDNSEKPLIPVAALDRRCFLKAAGAGAAVLALPTVAACGNGSNGGFADEDLSDIPDLGSSPDLNPGCKGLLNTAHTADMLAVGGNVFFANDSMFLCRDANGFYALTSTCTHEGCDVKPSGSAFRCPCHGAGFSFNGAVTRGPANSPLDHYALCLRGEGVITIDTRTVVDASVRLKL